MAITSVILHCEIDKVDQVKQFVEAHDDLQVYGLHEDQYLIVVAEIPSTQLETRLEELEKSEGVLAVYTTFVNTEDEME